MNVFFRFIPSEHTQTSSSIWPYLNLGNSPPNWSSFILFPFWFIVPAHGCIEASQVALVVKKPPANAGDRHGFDPWVRKIPCGGGHGSQLQYSCLKNPMAKEPGELHSMGSQSVGHDWCVLAHMHTHGCISQTPGGILDTSLLFSKRSSSYCC